MSHVFVPKLIGLQDTENHKRIRNIYNNLTGALSIYLCDVQILLKDETINQDWIILILNMNRAELVLFLKREFIMRNEIYFPGLNLEKLIRLDLIELPEEYDEIINIHDFYIEQNKLIEGTKFNFPLSRLKTEEGFDLNEEFETELLKFTATFTESEKQNEVLEAIQKFCDLIIEMKNLGIISKSKGAWQSASQIMGMAIDEDIRMEPSLFPSRYMFKKCRELNKFKAEPKPI